MSQLSNYDLSLSLKNHFKVSLESEQEVEITTDQVIINQELTVTHADDLAEDKAAFVEAEHNLDATEQAEVTLESLIASMESSVLRGGFDKTNAALANIAMESIAMRFDFNAQMLAFGMEAVEDDAEAETKSTIGKAKEMLSVLKTNTGALIDKIYQVAAGALGNNVALSKTLIATAAQLKANIDKTNKGGEILHLNQKFGKRISLGDGKVLPPEVFVKEFKRAIDKYNTVVKTYSDTTVLAKFINDTVKNAGDKPGEPESMKSIVALATRLGEDITVVASNTDGTEVKKSAPYLGGMVITATRPTLKTVEEALSFAVSKPAVSQEGIGTFVKGGAQILWGSLVFTCGLTILAHASVGAVVSVTSSLPVSLLGIGIAVLAFYGARMGAQIINKGFDNQAAEVGKAIDAISSKVKSIYQSIVHANTRFEVNESGVSMEATEVPFKALSLSPNQILDVANIVHNTALTTQTMNAELNKRKALIAQVTALTKALSKDGSNNAPMQKASAAFLKQFIKQTIKFEMDMVTYGVQTMKSAMIYAQTSNSSIAREASAAVENGEPM